MSTKKVSKEDAESFRLAFWLKRNGFYKLAEALFFTLPKKG